MDNEHWPLILIEGVLVFGGALAFGWWQLRSVKQDRARLQAQRARELEAKRQVAVTDEPPKPPPGQGH